jgi:hypothetical protein
MSIRLVTLAGCVLALVGCSSTGKGSEEVGADGKVDSFSNPTPHGTPEFGVPQEAEIRDGEWFHHWDFYLYGPATLTIRTQAADGDKEVDTVMYLYRNDGEGNGWGRNIKRNDDAGDSVFSKIRYVHTATEPTEFAVRVKPYTREDLGPFALVVECDGEGCTRPEGPATDPVCDVLDVWAIDICLPDDDAAVSFADCLEDVDMDDVSGDQREAARACCGSGDYIWCDELLPVTATEVALPANVVEAVRVNYEIGRSSWDSGGISAVTEYAVTNLTEDRLAAALLVLINDSADEPGSLRDFCANGIEGEENTAPAECAEHILREGQGENQIGGLLASEITGSDEEVSFGQALRTIGAYLDERLESPRVFTTTVDVWSVDVMQTIYINGTFDRIIVVSHDAGA